jgi:23S rRNA (uridine2552-2'-O)-methyltransferase
MARGKSSLPTGRRATVRVKTARGRTVSSQRWLQRQLNDPYVAEARTLIARARPSSCSSSTTSSVSSRRAPWSISALRPAAGRRSWSSGHARGRVAAVMASPRQSRPIAGATVLTKDFYDDDTPARLTELLGGPADVVLSDMAASATGDPKSITCASWRSPRRHTILPGKC